jgi:hypothetical protein
MSMDYAVPGAAIELDWKEFSEEALAQFTAALSQFGLELIHHDDGGDHYSLTIQRKERPTQERLEQIQEWVDGGPWWAEQICEECQDALCPEFDEQDQEGAA